MATLLTPLHAVCMHGHTVDFIAKSMECVWHKRTGALMYMAKNCPPTVILDPARKFNSLMTSVKPLVTCQML